jgi:hypothetical protein
MKSAFAKSVSGQSFESARLLLAAWFQEIVGQPPREFRVLSHG